MPSTGRLPRTTMRGTFHALGSNRDGADRGDDFFQTSLQSAHSGFYDQQSGSYRHLEAGSSGKTRVSAERRSIASRDRCRRQSSGQGSFCKWAHSGSGAAIRSRSSPRPGTGEFLESTRRVCSRLTMLSSNLSHSLDKFSYSHVWLPRCGHGLLPDGTHLRVEP